MLARAWLRIGMLFNAVHGTQVLDHVGDPVCFPLIPCPIYPHASSNNTRASSFILYKVLRALSHHKSGSFNRQNTKSTKRSNANEFWHAARGLLLAQHTSLLYIYRILTITFNIQLFFKELVRIGFSNSTAAANCNFGPKRAPNPVT